MNPPHLRIGPWVSVCLVATALVSLWESGARNIDPNAVIHRMNGFEVPPSRHFFQDQDVLVGRVGDTVFNIGRLERGKERRSLHILASYAARWDPEAEIEMIPNEACPLKFYVVFRLGEDWKRLRAEQRYPMADVVVAAGGGQYSLTMRCFEDTGGWEPTDMNVLRNLFKNAKLVDGNLTIPFEKTYIVHVPAKKELY